jgi:hypothetical protein
LFSRKILLISGIIAILIFTCSASAVSAPEKEVIPTKVKGSGTYPITDSNGDIMGYYQYSCDVKQLDNNFNGKGTFSQAYRTVKGNPTPLNLQVTAHADYVRIEGTKAIMVGIVTKSNCGPENCPQVGEYLGTYVVDSNPDRIAGLSDTDMERLISRLTPSWFDAPWGGQYLTKGNIIIG